MYSFLSLYVNLFLLFFLSWSVFGIGSKETERQGYKSRQEAMTMWLRAVESGRWGGCGLDLTVQGQKVDSWTVGLSTPMKQSQEWKGTEQVWATGAGRGGVPVCEGCFRSPWRTALWRWTPGSWRCLEIRTETMLETRISETSTWRKLIV